MIGYVGFRGTGVETRGNSAVDIALWDLLGQASGQPIYQLLGGLTRDKVRIYNTCAGYRYIRERPVQEVDNWGLPAAGAQSGPYEDLDAFLNRADDLALSLVEEGYTGMKIWPFDAYAHASDGMYISPADLDRALEPFRKIRRAVGNKIDIMVEFHSLWNLTAAKPYRACARGVQPVLVRGSGARRWAHRARRVRAAHAHPRVLERAARQPLGLSRSARAGAGRRRDVRSLLGRRHLRGPQDRGDGRGLASAGRAARLRRPRHADGQRSSAVNATNALVQEIVRASFFSWYRELVTELPKVERGYIHPLQGPGLGTRLQPGLEKRKDATVRRTGEAGSRVAR